MAALLYAFRALGGLSAGGARVQDVQDVQVPELVIKHGWKIPELNGGAILKKSRIDGSCHV